ncbi:vitamin K epoxide reductase family protein [Polyangium sorediatum]|uniref:Vitamin K epoxide reductase family protein n=1 Tax=Polyangium sorediatum TaxID=889274 RepID=A0ABT6NXP0_9BACT|nr:vitamin K epoxide reductase family protein [Polyangium sorediatum]MDI1433066.1 vitamin K epoxide reductase family protein [Polyangium sorediatum]
MSGAPRRWPSALALVASLIGLVFGGLSTLDYSKHLDRQVHDIHCSFVPGLAAGGAGENACRAAMYSPYSALFRDRYWGGIPISLFAVGAFAFFASYALYLLLAGPRAPRRAAQFFGAVSLTPLLVSALMFAISALKLGQYCKTCVGIYISSVLLAVSGIFLLLDARSKGAPAPAADKPEGAAEGAGAGRPVGSLWLVPGWLLALGIFTITPTLIYLSALPSYASYITGCGKLAKPTEPNNALLRHTPAGAKQPATLFVDPLCPTCKAFHKRLEADGIFERLDTTLVLFPLDNECNWMLDRPLHPGACLVSKAVLCGENRAVDVLEWAYDNQERLLEGAKSPAGLATVRSAIREKWSNLDACIDSKDTKLRLDRMLRHIVNNQLQVSTPQLFLGDTRLCDEDSDIGLAYSIRKLAPDLRLP